MWVVFLAIFVYDVAYDILYDIQKNCDVAYDMQHAYCYYTISYVHIVYISLLYDIVRPCHKKHTMLPYYVAYDCSYKYLDWHLRRVALAMPLERPQVLPHDPRPSPMVCTASSQS